MPEIRFQSGENIPLEMHKVRMVQKLNLNPVEKRAEDMEQAGFNTFLLKNKDVFLDMLTDSGVNAMSDQQYAAMLVADDSYAGSETYFRLEKTIGEIFGTKFFLPAHQGRACENIIATTLVKPGSVVLTNFHFTTTMAHITRNGGSLEELVGDEGLNTQSDCLFKGNYDLQKLNESITRNKGNIAFLRVEAGTNLIGGQPISLGNMRDVTKIARENGIVTVLDASLLSDNMFFIKTREEEFKDTPLIDIAREIASLFDITYFSARKLGCARGGGIMVNDQSLFEQMREFIPLFEGFLTYGGMSVREMEALNVGLWEAMDLDVISQTPIFVKAFADELIARGVPVVTPAGGLGCHIDAGRFVPHIPQDQYPAGALAAAIFIAGGIRGMERGTLSEQRREDGTERLANMELVRLALPKRVFTLSQIKYAADRIAWLHDNRDLIGGLTFVEEPSTMRFFFGRLEAKSDWTQKLIERFRADFGDSL